MAGPTHQVSEHWSSRWAFIMAAIGSAVGLGNIWRFPTLAGENGGGAFVLVYIACVALIGLPVLLSEILIGRRGRSDAVGSIRNLAAESNAGRGWPILGMIGATAAFLVLSFYSVVAGWVVYYAGVMGADLLTSIGNGDPFGPALQGETTEQVQGRMVDLFGNVPLLLVMHFVFMGITMFVVLRGVHDGIEKAATWLMPTFFVLLIGITVYGAFVGDLGGAFAFLLTPDFGKLDAAVINTALGQALFSLGVGAAALITYGAYIDNKTNLASSAATIAVADTLVAFVAGLMIFPIVFAVGLDPAAGPTLVFQSIPVAFQQMPAGSLIGFLFFVLIFFAALTSSISLLEVPTAIGINEFGWRRSVSATIFGGGAFLVGIACLLSLNLWSEVRLLPFWSIFADANIFDTIDGFTGKVMLPVAALLTSILIGWRADRKIIAADIGLEGPLFGLWRFLIAWLCPLAVLLILLFGLFPELVG